GAQNTTAARHGPRHRGTTNVFGRRRHILPSMTSISRPVRQNQGRPTGAPGTATRPFSGKRLRMWARRAAGRRAPGVHHLGGYTIEARLTAQRPRAAPGRADAARARPLARDITPRGPTGNGTGVAAPNPWSTAT